MSYAADWSKADIKGDLDLDSADFGRMQRCSSGVGVIPTSSLACFVASSLGYLVAPQLRRFETTWPSDRATKHLALLSFLEALRNGQPRILVLLGVVVAP